MSDLQIEMSAFHDELLKEGAHPAFEIARQVLSRGAQRAAGAVAHPNVMGVVGAGLRGVRGAARAAGGGIASGGRSVGQTLSNFGKRQLHSVTGWTPKAGVESIGMMGSKATGEALQAAQAAAPTRGATTGVRGLLGKVMHGRQAGTHGLAKKTQERAVQRAQKLHEATQASESMGGLSSLPSWAGAMIKDPKAALKAGLGREWHSGTLGKAMVAFPAVAAGHQLLKPTQEGGPGKLERAGKSLGEAAWAMGMPIAGATLAAKGIAGAAGGAGRVLGRLKGPRKPELGRYPAPPSIDAGGNTQPVERHMSPAAAGLPPEDVIS